MNTKLNIYSDYPSTPYEANITYYRSSNEDTFLRDLFIHTDGSRGLDINQEAIQELLDERDELQENLIKTQSLCMSSDSDILNYNTKDTCESKVDSMDTLKTVVYLIINVNKTQTVHFI